MKKQLLTALLLFSSTGGFVVTANALTANDLYKRSFSVKSESLTRYLEHTKSAVESVDIHQGTSLNFGGDQGESYWMRQKNSARLALILRFFDGSRSIVWLEAVPFEASDALYKQSIPTRVTEDQRNKVFARLPSLGLVNELLGNRTVQVVQLTLLEPVTTYATSN